MKVPTLEFRYPEHDEAWELFVLDQAAVEKVLVLALSDQECLALACGLFSGRATPARRSERYGPLELRLAR